MDKEADKGFIAAYRTLSPDTLKEKICFAEEMLKSCSLCPPLKRTITYAEYRNTLKEAEGAGLELLD